LELRNAVPNLGYRFGYTLPHLTNRQAGGLR
jgi:hypothetical protein